jgi:hemerythrin
VLLAWKEDFAIDHGVIDDDHQFLIRKLNTALRRLSNNAPVGLILETAQSVRDFAARHFTREERLQASVDYPFLAEHRLEHQVLLGQLDHVLETLGELPADSEIVDPHEMKTFFYNWILGHIIGSDRKIAPFVGPTRIVGASSLASMSTPKPQGLHWRDWAFGQ